MPHSVKLLTSTRLHQSVGRIYRLLLRLQSAGTHPADLEAAAAAAAGRIAVRMPCGHLKGRCGGILGAKQCAMAFVLLTFMCCGPDYERADSVNTPEQVQSWSAKAPSCTRQTRRPKHHRSFKARESR